MNQAGNRPDGRIRLPTKLDDRIRLYQGDNLQYLATFDQESFSLIYIDPPFNTGRTQRRTRIKAVRDRDGDRTGFAGHRYRTKTVGSSAYQDSFEDYLGFLRPRLQRSRELLTADGSLLVHLDYREVHYVKVMLDEIFGRNCFINEIIWSYDYGGRSSSRWSAKHDNILWYAKDPNNYVFNLQDCDRIPYMAPKLVGPAKAARGKYPTDSWWHTIVAPNSREKTGYPTQKPLGIIRRIVAVHSNPGDNLLDFFAGSGTFGIAALEQGRHCTLIDSNPAAIEVMVKRLEEYAASDPSAKAEDKGS